MSGLELGEKIVQDFKCFVFLSDLCLDFYIHARDRDNHSKSFRPLRSIIYRRCKARLDGWEIELDETSILSEMYRQRYPQSQHCCIRECVAQEEKDWIDDLIHFVHQLGTSLLQPHAPLLFRLSEVLMPCIAQKHRTSFHPCYFCIRVSFLGVHIYYVVSSAADDAPYRCF